MRANLEIREFEFLYFMAKIKLKSQLHMQHIVDICTKLLLSSHLAAGALHIMRLNNGIVLPLSNTPPRHGQPITWQRPWMHSPSTGSPIRLPVQNFQALIASFLEISI